MGVSLKGRAFRFNLLVRPSPKGFPLQSLTQTDVNATYLRFKANTIQSSINTSNAANDRPIFIIFENNNKPSPATIKMMYIRKFVSDTNELQVML